MIADTITQKIGEVMKAKDEIRLSTLRMLSSALNYEKIDKQHTLSEEEELEVVRREAKKRRDAIEAYKKAGANERADTGLGGLQPRGRVRVGHDLEWLDLDRGRLDA